MGGALRLGLSDKRSFTSLIFLLKHLSVRFIYIYFTKRTNTTKYKYHKE